MTTIQPSIASSIGNTQDIQTAHKKCQDAQSSTFDALLAIFTSDANSSGQSASASSASASSNSLGQTDSLGSIFSVLLSENTAGPSSGASGFSSDFLSTFGDSGPLLDYINMITSKLHLSSQQNQALQDIAVQNKDATASDTTVQSIAAELAAAGIGVG